MDDRKIGVLVMSYGTPESMDDIEEYYTHIRRGNPPTPEQLADLTNRYDAIVGGFFPLRENTDRQVCGLQEALDAIAPDTYVCYQGLKHARPYIEDGVKKMAEDGIREAIGIVLAPHYSIMSVGSYIKRAQESAEAQGLKMAFVKEYHLHPKLIRTLTARVQHGLKKFGADVPATDVKVLFSAHSLPERIIEMNDPYPQQLLATSAAVAEGAGVTDWQFTWQSAGRTREPWLGPDILDTLQEVREKGANYVLIAPIGFVSDHLEILYDVDIEAKSVAQQLGLKLERIEMLNTDPLYMETLAESVIALQQERG
ncbi:ferrochelatase [Paenibacillus abyssi]|uniref:Coproporphyrin III ferrochelatase n=1 Tax=Paenibacillus abyssi TaxID=1340531 RepID=A0A917LE59_9BACL|nr:ferrochelatase [Paenibacillus abyssi]GGG15680.1 ferrochelatase [Paenibacillus abyssi]